MKELDSIISSNPLKITLSKGVGEYVKGIVRPITIKGERLYQLELLTKTQAFHENLTAAALSDKLSSLFGEKFRQIDATCESAAYSLGLSKKDKVLFSKRAVAASATVAEHNRKKNYILEEGTPVPALVDLGVMTPDGRVVKARYDKFKQINRFTELVDDVLKNENKENFSVIDFGCGKSYLTFVLYHYLCTIKGAKANIIGLDLKTQVIADCNEIAKKYGYEGLSFKEGDISGFPADMPCDMVITLHACDTATDFALYNAIKRGAKYIMSVPCCQHEINLAMKSCDVPLMADYGIIKERFCALATDAIRAALLTYCGYETQVVEFIDISHSPKNIMLRAVKKNIPTKTRDAALAKATELLKILGTEQTLYKLITKKEA